MAAYYFAAHFPMVHANTVEPPSSAPTNTTVGVQSQTPHVPTPTKPVKAERADSVISAAELPRNHSMSGQTESDFFRLPAELRNQIYEELLCANTPSSTDLKSTSKLPTPAPTYPAILSTCKRIHAEAVDLLYTTHVFHAHPSLLTSLPNLTSPSKPILYPTVLHKIHRWQLTIRLDTDPGFTAPQAKSAFSGAEYLELKARQSMFDGCNAAVLKLFTGVRGVKICKITGSVDPELAAWLQGVMMAPEEAEDAVEWCECEDERYVKCCGCDRRVRDGAWKALEERDAWRFGIR